MENKEFIIHIGAPRTGSSYLRKKVFPFIENVYYENKHNNKYQLASFTEKIAHYGDGDELSASISDIQLPFIDAKKILISEEHLIWSVYHMMGNIGSRALLLKEKFPKAKIILTIRRQPEFFISLYKYFQTLNTSHLQRQIRSIENMLSIEHTVQKAKIYHKKFIPIGLSVEEEYTLFDVSEKYFDRYYRHFIAADFSWHRIYSIYSNLYGKDNILVLPQEMLKSDIDLGIELLSSFIKEEIFVPANFLSSTVNESAHIKSPFVNKRHKDYFVNYILSVNSKANSRLNRKICSYDLSEYKYFSPSFEKRRTVSFGICNGAKTELSEQKCRYLTTIYNVFCRKGLLGLVGLIASKIKKKLLRKFILILRQGYLSCLLIIDYATGCDFQKNESLKELGLDSNFSEQYEPTKIFEIKKIFADIILPENTVAIDFGSGKGGMLVFLAKLRKVQKVYGVELSKKLCCIAKSNIAKKKISCCEILNIDAKNIPSSILNTSNLIYFYNPFPRNVFENVFKRIEGSISNNKRKLIIVYFNPVYSDFIEKSVFLKRFKVYKNIISFASTNVYYLDGKR